MFATKLLVTISNRYQSLLTSVYYSLYSMSNYSITIHYICLLVQSSIMPWPISVRQLRTGGDPSHVGNTRHPSLLNASPTIRIFPKTYGV